MTNVIWITHLPVKKRIGILGDGQLARMLAQAAQSQHAPQPLNVEVVVLARNDASPAAKVGVKKIMGQPGVEADLERFFAAVDWVTFENEFADCDLLRRVQEKVRVEFKPSLDVIEKLQNKLSQKILLGQLKIPNPQFLLHKRKEDPAQWMETVRAHLGPSFVLKWATLGYDGKGVLLVKENTPQARIIQFCTEAIKQGIEIFAEEWITFDRELAIAASYSKASGFACYPLVISEQRQGICDRVKGPARNLGVPESMETQAKTWIQMLAEHLNYEGTLAIEFFQTSDGRLLVNEIAPRVHNTAHYSQDACEVSQFENHLRAISGEPLGATGEKGFFAMINLLGPEGVSRTVNDLSCLPPGGKGFHCHWYEKQDIVPGRKLGHLNACAATETGLTEVLQVMNDWVAAWTTNLKKL